MLKSAVETAVKYCIEMAKNPKTAVPSNFYGRRHALDWLHQLVFASEAQRSSPLILVHGVSGLGKTALCEHFLAQREGDLEATWPLVSMQCRGAPQNHSIIRFSDMLLETARASVGALGGHKKVLYFGVANDLMSRDALEGIDGMPREIYDSVGAAHLEKTGQDVHSQEQEQKIALAFGERLLEWLRHGIDLNPATDLSRIVFIFDEFETYQAPVKRWIGRYLYPALQGLEELPDCAYILTGQKTWGGGGQADYWQVPPRALRQYALTPLARHECEQWLLATVGDLKLLDVLIEETEGVPLRIKALLEDPSFLEAKLNRKDGEDPLGAYTAQQRRWLHASSMSKKISLEAMQVLLGKQEGQAAFDWLRFHGQLLDGSVAGVEGMEVIALSPALRELVLNQSVSKLPLRHQEFSDKMKLLGSLTEHVSLLEHRHYLSKLSSIQPFNEALINDVFGTYE